MSEVKWTDDAIESRLNDLSDMPTKPPNYLSPGEYGEHEALNELSTALLELKRVRAWVKYALDNRDDTSPELMAFALVNLINGDPAPGGEEKQ